MAVRTGRGTACQACLKSPTVYANMSDRLGGGGRRACIPEVHAVSTAELPVGLSLPTSLLSMVMNGDVGMGTFSLHPLALSLSKPHTLISMAVAAITWL